jgi:predicted transcriptional regulator
VFDLHPLLPKEKLLDYVREAQRQLGVSSSEIGRHAGLNQPSMSNLLNPASKNPRELSYEEAYDIVQYLVSRVSLLPAGLKAGDIMTGHRALVWATGDQTLSEVARVMFERGFSQMPVRDKETGSIRGVVTDLSILKALMGGVGNEASSIDELRRMTLAESGLVESVLECPRNSLLLDAAYILRGYPAVLISSGSEIIGILTRSDLLKLMWLRKLSLY